MDADEVLAGLDPEQREVATALHGPVCVLAGAGTGKTRAITHRVAYGVHAGVFSPSHVLAVTFTTRAAAELRARLRALGVVGTQARTFHSAALRQLTYFWPRVVGGELPRLTASKASMLAEAAGRVRVAVSGPVLRDLAAEIEWAKVTRTAPQDYPTAAAASRRVPPAELSHAAFGQLYAAYEEVKRVRSAMDFEDVLLLAVGILSERPEIAEQVRGQYRHLVVDEYQDVNPLQQSLMELWLGGRDDLCVVGDASQTIYSFTGATPRFLLEFGDRYPAATMVRLVRDYRSTPQVVSLANGLLRSAPTRLQLVAQRPPGPEPSFRAFSDEPAEAAAVAMRAAELVKAGVPAAEMAVLFRTNAQSEAFEEALGEAGIAYVLRGAERFFERPEVRQAVLLLRGAARAAASLGPAEEQRVGPVSLLDSATAVLETMGWNSVAPAGSGAARDRWESLAAILRLVDELAAAEPDAGLVQLVEHLDERIAHQHAPTVDGVTLASMHAAKGLEWSAVFLVGLADGTVPISYAESSAQLEEERRLLYVGVTRAREHLWLSWASARSPGGRASRRPSRFLEGLRPDDPTPRAGGRGPAARGRRSARTVLPTACGVCGVALTAAADRRRGRCTSCPPPYDEALFERLRGWRKEQADAAGVPAYVVFSDATLEAVATSRPSSPIDLARIAGVGSVKLERYGADLISLVRSSD